MKLYFNKFTRATRPRHLLEELGVPYDLVTLDLSKGEHKTPAYLQVHPHGRLPAIEDDGQVVFESAAICLYLADRFPEAGLAPAPGSPDRGPYYQWVVYSVATLEDPVLRTFTQIRKPEAERDADAMAKAAADFDECAAVLSQALAGRTWLLGETFTAADVMIGSVLAWGDRMGLNNAWPTLQDYVRRFTARPAFQAARS